MADPYIGEIRVFPYYSFSSEAPYGWLLCNGQIISIQQYQALFAVIQNIYGGNFQQQNFALPNLMGYAPVGMGQGPGLSNYALGKPVATQSASVALNLSQVPAHSHSVAVTLGNGNAMNPPNSQFLSNPAGAKLDLPATRAVSSSAYKPFGGFSTTANAQLAPNSLAVAGSGTAPTHENRQPFLAFLFCIAYMGVFPVKES